MGKLGILRVVNQIPYGDKAGHFILYGILTLLLDLTLFRARPASSPNLLVFRIALILALIIGLEEYFCGEGCVVGKRFGVGGFSS